MIPFSAKQIPLTRGKFAHVSAADFSAVSRLSWCAVYQRGRWYGMRRQGSVEGNQINQYLHHLVLPKVQGLDVDHRDCDGLNCCRSNLRYAPRWGNNANRRKSSGLSSKFKGVTWDDGVKKWRAQIKFQGRRRYLGVHRIEEDAARAYDKQARKLFGRFARPNFL
jgi:hypothetical protein